MKGVTKSKKVVLKISGDALRKVIQKPPASVKKKRKQTSKITKLRPQSGKTGVLSTIAAKAQAERVRKLKAARVPRATSDQVQQIFNNTEYRIREAELVQKSASYWETITDSDNEQFEWAELFIDASTPPIPILIRKSHDSLTDDERGKFTQSEYLVQALQHKLQLPITKFGILSQVQQAYQTVAMERIEAIQENKPLPFVPVTSIVPPLITMQPRPSLHMNQAGETFTEQPMLPVLPPPDFDDPMYQTPPLQYIQVPDQPPRIGRYKIDDYAYHYAAAIRDNAIFPPALHPRDQEVQTDFSMMALNNIRQFNDNFIDPNLLIGTTLTTSHNGSHSSTDVSSTDMSHLSMQSAPNKPHCPKRTFHRTQLLAEMRYEARMMYENRRGRARAASIVARHCVLEAQWRERSRGRFISGNGTFLMHEPHLSTENPLYVLAEAATQSRGGLGYQREGIALGKGQNEEDAHAGQENEESKNNDSIDEVYEVEKWRTAEQWQEIVRTGGTSLQEEERTRLGFRTEKYSITSVPEQGVAAALDLHPWSYDFREQSTAIATVVPDYVWGVVEGYILKEPNWE